MENSKLSNVKGKELVAAGHAFAKVIGMDTPLIEVAKMVSELATRLDCALVRGDELQKERDALAAENVPLKAAIAKYAKVKQDFDDFDGDRRGIAACLCEAEDALVDGIKTPATDAYLNSVRAEGLEMLAAEHQAIVDTLNGDSLFADGERRHASIAAAAVHFAAKLRAGEPS
ncbi:conserved hypothetical protein [Pantoea brenneri]|uniref:Ead/Ea22-like family protein n=1 Tax=Pantoea brenneri TaxID=472694 RepID=A0AAX3J4A5_9GAMM|nr:hypothetical protein [Pantoea brenneri]VXB51532.1 conserved hypothetical protein [Pantoea brenneri]